MAPSPHSLKLMATAITPFALVACAAGGSPDVRAGSPVLAQSPLAAPADTGCPDRQDKLSSELCAQWKAADAAADSAVWTKIIGGLGVFISATTLFAAVKAALYAKRAALAAEAGSAAYFSLINLEYSLPRLGDHMLVTIELQNFGTTPAREYRATWRYEYGPAGRQFDAIDDEDFTKINPDNIGPGAPVRIVRRRVNLGRAAIRDIRRGQASFYLRGRIEFSDVSGNCHRIDFGRRSKHPVNESRKRIGGDLFYYTSRWAWKDRVKPHHSLGEPWTNPAST